MTSDSALVALAGSGDSASYDELHRRHVLAAWGLAQAITRDDVTALAAVQKAMPAVFAAIDRGGYPSGLPVRWAVLAATRAAALTLLHSSSWTGSPQHRDLVDRSFSGLPECWRTALWLAEVERLKPVDAANALRMTPDDAAALMARARDGFAARYLRTAAAARGEDCRAVLPLLPEFQAGTLAPHAVAEVDQHLAACRPCRMSNGDLEAVGAALRRVALPTPLLAVRSPGASHPAAARRPARLAPAVAALVAAIFGIGSISAVSHKAPNPPQQVASPVEAVQPVRDPVPIHLSIAATADRSIAAPAALPPSARTDASPPSDLGVVAMGDTLPVPADLGAASVPPGPDETGDAPVPRSASPDVDDGDAATPSASTAPEPGPEPAGDQPVAASAEVAGVGVSVAVDPASSEPVDVDLSIAAPSEGLSALGSGT